MFDNIKISQISKYDFSTSSEGGSTHKCFIKLAILEINDNMKSFVEARAFLTVAFESTFRTF